MFCLRRSKTSRERPCIRIDAPATLAQIRVGTLCSTTLTLMSYPNPAPLSYWGWRLLPLHSTLGDGGSKRGRGRQSTPGPPTATVTVGHSAHGRAPKVKGVGGRG